MSAFQFGNKLGQEGLHRPPQSHLADEGGKQQDGEQGRGKQDGGSYEGLLEVDG